MFSMLKTAALSALIGLGAIGAVGVAPAAAQSSVYLGIGGGHHGAGAGVWFGDVNHSYRRPHHGWDRPHGGRPGWHGQRSCSPRQAVNKAERMGMRRAHVRHVGNRTISVGGRRYGEYTSVRFARAPGCPVIRY